MALTDAPGSGAPPRTALWVVPVADLGGVARHVLDVAGAGIPGWRLVVLCPAGPLADRLRTLGADVRTGPIGPAAGTRASVVTLRHTVRAVRPALVHSHLSHADIVAALATPRGIPIVTTEHGIAADDRVYHGSTQRARLMADVHRMRLRRAAAIVAVSEATRTAMLDKWHPRTPITVIHNGIDRPADLEPRTARRHRAPRDGGHVVALARLAPEKRLPELVDAFAVLRRRRPRARLTLAGIGPLDGALRAQVRRLGLDDAVELPGHVEAGPLLARADVVAQLSVWENCSYTLLDAIVAGLGVVASPVGGNPELLPARCLVDPADPAAVADRLAAQADDPTARPWLPDGWPSVADMCARIADVYAALSPVAASPGRVQARERAGS